MNLARRLIRIQAALAIATGLSLPFVFHDALGRLPLPGNPHGFVLFFGLTLAAFGLAIWPMSRLEWPADLRRLSLGLLLVNLPSVAAAVLAVARSPYEPQLSVPLQLGLERSPYEAPLSVSLQMAVLALALVHLGLLLAFLRAILQINDLERSAGEDLLYLPESSAREPWLRQLSEAAAREERHRLARELHDSIKQQLFSIKLGAAAADARWESDPGGARAALGDVRRSAQAAMAEMQALLSQLRPVALSGTGLVEALREQCEALGYRTGAQVDLHLGEMPPEDQLPASAREHLFRIAQEALSNIARHARASTVEVRLEPSGFEETVSGPSPEMVSPLSLSGIATASATARPTTLSLLVRDDGQGFDPGAIRQGLGLRHIRERAQAVGGTVEIDSRPGGGTELRVTIPLHGLEPSVLDPVQQTFYNEKWIGFAAVVLALNALDNYYSMFQLWVVLYAAIVSYGSCYGRFAATLAPGPLSRLRQHGHLQRSFFLLAGGWWALHLAQRGQANQSGLYSVAAAMGLAAIVEAALFLHRHRRGEDSPPGALPLLGALLATPVIGALLLLSGSVDPAVLIRGGVVATCLLYVLWVWRSRGWARAQWAARTERTP